jgi:hypothetical protein
MRLFEGAKQLHVRELGPVPGVDELIAGVMELDLLSPDTITNEEVFFGTHRIVATNEFAKTPQKYAKAGRNDRLLELTVSTTEWLRTIYPACTPVLVQCATLPPGAELKWHIDSYLYQNESHKIHIPIATNAEAMYQSRQLGRLDDRHFEVRQAYEINNILLHRSVNHGETPRTHVVIDMMTNAAIEHFAKRNIDFFFTHHPANAKLEQTLLKATREA